MRTKEQIYDELKEIQDFIKKGIPQDIHAMQETLSTLTSYLGSSGELQSEAGYLYESAFESAFAELKKQYADQDKKLTPSLAKMFVTGIVAEQNALYVLACRMNAAVTHAGDNVRSALSTEKIIMQKTH